MLFGKIGLFGLTDWVSELEPVFKYEKRQHREIASCRLTLETESKHDSALQKNSR
jgi:hypothetical protein